MGRLNTTINKAIIAFLVAAVIQYANQHGLTLPVEVTDAMQVILDWGVPILVGLAGGFLVWLVPNKKE